MTGHPVARRRLRFRRCSPAVRPAPFFTRGRRGFIKKNSGRMFFARRVPARDVVLIEADAAVLCKLLVEFQANKGRPVKKPIHTGLVGDDEAVAKTDDWNAEAVRVAGFVRRECFGADRGALPWHNRLVIVFGNLPYSDNDRTQREGAHMRERLGELDPPADELGFGVDHGCTWVMLLRAPSDEDVRRIADQLNDAVWQGFYGGPVPRHVQRSIARTAILSKLEPPLETERTEHSVGCAALFGLFMVIVFGLVVLGLIIGQLALYFL